MSKPLITRIAPSPTGDMHLGTARTAYFNWLAARATGGTFILRIDDTDVSRNSQQSLDDIYEIMEWLGLDFDITFKQSDRVKSSLYAQAAELLISKDLAERRDGAVFIKNYQLPSFWTDQITGQISISKSDTDVIDNLVLLRSDGTPTYHFASVVDDLIPNDEHLTASVNFIIRGVDHIKNTPKHLAIYDVLLRSLDPSMLQFIEMPQFAHVGLIFDGGKKLSKRDSAASMLSYKRAGYDPEAMLNYILRLGWGPTVDDKSTAVLTKEDALKLFLAGGKMRAAKSNFDKPKLDSFDRKYKAKKKEST